MHKIRLTVSVIIHSLHKDIVENRKIVIAYVVVFIVAGGIAGLLKYVIDTVTGHINNPDFHGNTYTILLINDVIFQMCCICIACLLRRYWQFYGYLLILVILTATVITTLSMFFNPNIAWLRMFLTVLPPMLLSLIGPTISAIVFYGLCKLAGLPSPQNSGWKPVLV